MRDKSKISDRILAAEYEAVFRYALTLTRSEHDAQDITQETFLKAMESADKFRGKSSLYTYLCSIAKNLWIDKCRKQNREIPEEAVPLSADAGSDFERKVADRDLSLYVHRVLHELKEPIRRSSLSVYSGSLRMPI